MLNTSCLYCGIAGVLLACEWRGLGSVPGKSMKDLCWEKWHWDICFQVPLSFLVSIIPPMLHSHISFLYYHLTNSLTPCSRVLENVTVSWLAKKFPAFYGAQRFLTAFMSLPPVPALIQVNLFHAHHPIPWSIINLQSFNETLLCLFSTCQYSQVVELLPHIQDCWVQILALGVAICELCCSYPQFADRFWDIAVK
jgi:hypothetical protein